MSFQVQLRDTVTGETRLYADDWDGHDWSEGVPFIWAEGNFSCDHNRHLFWIRASGREPTHEETKDDECHMGPGFTLRFAVDFFLLPDGTKVPGPQAPEET